MAYAVYAAIVVAISIVILCIGFYNRRDRDRGGISTTEWIRLMRKNDIRYDRATNARLRKSGSS